MKLIEKDSVKLSPPRERKMIGIEKTEAVQNSSYFFSDFLGSGHRNKGINNPFYPGSDGLL
ncbi:hypothetical protein GcC1_072017, partial [Golovinomyces cichoracearum]